MGYLMKDLDEAIRFFVGGKVVDAVCQDGGIGASRPELVKKAALNIFLQEGKAGRLVSKQRDIIAEALADLQQYGCFNFLPEEAQAKKTVEHKVPSSMTDKDRYFLAKLLQLASEHAARHICNDLPKELCELYSQEEWIQITKEFHEWNGDPEEFEKCPELMIQNDAALMHFFAAKLLQRDKI